MNTITYEFLKLGSDESSRFSLIQAETPCQAFLGKKPELYEKTVKHEMGWNLDIVLDGERAFHAPEVTDACLRDGGKIHQQNIEYIITVYQKRNYFCIFHVLVLHCRHLIIPPIASY